MGFFDRIFKRVRDHHPEPVIGEDGFVHAPDAVPEEVINPPRRGNSGLLPEFGGPPHGWGRVLGQGTALGPWSSDGGSDDSSGGDYSSSDGGGGGGGGE